MTLEAYLRANYSPNSIRSYLNTIKRFELLMAGKAETANHRDIVDYIGLLREQKQHPKSLRNNLFAIKIYYRYLLAIGKRSDHPCQHLYLKDQINRQIAVESLYSKETLTELYQNHQSKKEDNQKRDKIIISLLIYQALTTLEISQLKVEDIDLEAGTIRIQENQKNRGRTLSLKPQQILLFHNYLQKDWLRFHKKQRPSKRLDYFILSENGVQIWKSGINRMLNRGREKYDKLTAIKIRQSVIAHLLQAGHDIRIVQEFAGHRRTASTEAYQQTGLEELKSAIDRLHPLQ